MANTGKSYKCSICDSTGHTARNHNRVMGPTFLAVHGNAPQMPQVESKGRACSYCYQSGHYAPKCSARLADEADKLIAKRRAATAILGFSEYHPAHRFVSAHVVPVSFCK